MTNDRAKLDTDFVWALRRSRHTLEKCISRLVIVALSAQPPGGNKLCVCTENPFKSNETTGVSSPVASRTGTASSLQHPVQLLNSLELYYWSLNQATEIQNISYQKLGINENIRY